MKTNKLNQTLETLSKQALPSLPSDFQNEVWREIRHRKVVNPVGWREKIEATLGFLLRPLPVTASLVLALLLGMAGALPGHKHNSASLGLDAFDPKAADINITGNVLK